MPSIYISLQYFLVIFGVLVAVDPLIDLGGVWGSVPNLALYTRHGAGHLPTFFSMGFQTAFGPIAHITILAKILWGHSVALMYRMLFWVEIFMMVAPGRLGFKNAGAKMALKSDGGFGHFSYIIVNLVPFF